MAADDLPTPTPREAAPLLVQAGPLAPGEGLQTASRPEEVVKSIPLPPPVSRPPLDLQRLARASTALDVFLVGTVLLLAFLVASFPARNPDLWLDLAAGRALVDGSYNPFRAADPFSWASHDATWVNYSWLYDLLAFGIYRVLGGTVLLVLKALLLTAVAEVLLRLSRVGRALWAPAVGTALVILGLTAWVPLRPVCLSYLFLALTLLFLERPHRLSAPVSFRSYWPLLPLFVLWVNLDSWFFLGPLTVALYALGGWLQGLTGPGSDSGHEAKGRGEARVLGLVLLAGLAACLINPHHIRAFTTLPAELGLSATTDQLRQDSLFRRLGVSPFEASYFRGSVLPSVAGAAYLSLAVLGLLSFALNRAGWRWSRGLVWLALLLLSAWQARAMPFFVLAAGPFLALNLQEVLARLAPSRAHPSPEGAETLLRLGLAGRLLTALACLGLLVAAWPGWLQASPFDRRSWQVEPDLSLQRAAEQLARWRQQGQLPAGEVAFNFLPESACYFAWFGPQEKGFVDSRLALCTPEQAADYVTVRRALLGDVDGADQDWRSVLRAHHISHVVLSECDSGSSAPAFRLLVLNAQEWPLLWVGGHTAIFGWRDPRNPGTDEFQGLTLDLDRLAFDPPDDQKAPLDWPGQEPEAPTWYDPFLTARPPRAFDRAEANLHLRHFDALASGAINGHLWRWANSLSAGVVGAGGLPSPATPFDLCLKLHLADIRPAPTAGTAGERPRDILPLECAQRYVRSQDDGPPALLYLAVRAARRALAANPDDAQAYLLLGEAYLRFVHRTGERDWVKRVPSAGDPRKPVWEQRRWVPLLGKVRKVQIITALEHAVRLSPDLEQPHLDLAELYEEMNYLDLALEHRKKHLQHTREAGPLPGETEEQFAARLERLEELVSRREREVNRHQDFYEVNSSNLPVLDRTQLALREGLALRARSVLVSTDNAAFPPVGLGLELDLLMSTGWTREAREWPAPNAAKIEAALGRHDYHQLQAQLAAGIGAYRQDDQEIRQMIATSFLLPEVSRTPITFRTAMAVAVGQTVLDRSPQEGGVPALLHRELKRADFSNRVSGLASQLRQAADLTVLRGLVALEAGQTQEAEAAFREALVQCPSDDAAASGAGIDFPARSIARHCLTLLEEARRKEANRQPTM